GEARPAPARLRLVLLLPRRGRPGAWPRRTRPCSPGGWRRPSSRGSPWRAGVRCWTGRRVLARPPSIARPCARQWWCCGGGSGHKGCSSLCLSVAADGCLGHTAAQVVPAAVVGECVGDVLVCVRPLTADVCAQPHACGGGVFGVAVVHVRENGVDLAAVHGRGEGGETHSASSSMGA